MIQVSTKRKGVVASTGEINVMAPFNFAALAVQGHSVPATESRSGSVQMFSEGDIGMSRKGE